MKFYVFFVAFVVLCCAARQATAYVCPDSHPPLYCPVRGGGPVRCFTFCARAMRDTLAPTLPPSSDGYLCPMTDVRCPYKNAMTCLRWCGINGSN